MYYISYMFMRQLILLILLQVTVFFQYAHGAAQAGIGPAPAWLLTRNPDYTRQADTRDISSGHYFTLHDIQVNVAEQTNYVHYITVITNKTGVQNHSEINISFPGTYQKLTFHELTITRGTQRINKLSQSAIKVVDEEPFMSEYQIHDYTSAIIILDDVREGDKIELAYSLKGFNPVLGSKYDNIINLYAQSPITNNYTSILMPAGRKLNYKCYNDAPAPQVKNEGNYTVYDWPVMELKPVTYEGNTPAWYIENKYVFVSEFTNWNEVALWANSLTNGVSMQLPPALLQLADEWEKKAGASKITFAEMALRFVQNDIRYLGIEIGEYTHRPHSPAETFNKRYGDCKDKSLLLAAILRTRDIPADLVLVNTGMKEHVVDWLPGKNFNHVIVRLKIDGSVKYVDPTASNQYGSLMSTYLPNYGKGLVISAASTDLEKIPFDNEGSIVVNETFDISEDSTVTLLVETVYFNRDANDIRSTFKYSSMAEMEKNYEEYYSRLYGNARMSTEMSYEDDTINNFVTVREDYILKDAWTESNGEKTLEVGSRMIYDRLTEPVKKAMNKPLHLYYPANITHNITLHTMEETSVNDEPIEILEDDYLFRFNATAEGKSITIKYEYRSFNDHIPVEHLDKYTKDHEEITNALSYGISVNQKMLNELKVAKAGGILAKTNKTMLFAMLVFAALTYYLLRRQNRKNAYTGKIVNYDAGLTGWLAFFAFVVCIKPALYLYKIFAGGYLETETWVRFSSFDSFVPQLYVIIEGLLLVVFCTFSFWVAYWTFKKRDILPRMFMILAVSELAYNFILLVIGVIFNDRIGAFYPELIVDMTKATFKSTVYILIWGLALYKSDKAQEVFTRPYSTPAVDNDAGEADDNLTEGAELREANDGADYNTLT